MHARVRPLGLSHLVIVMPPGSFSLETTLLRTCLGPSDRGLAFSPFRGISEVYTVASSIIVLGMKGAGRKVGELDPRLLASCGKAAHTGTLVY